MEIDPAEPSQRQKDSEDDKVAAAVEAVAKQVAAVEEQVAMMASDTQETPCPNRAVSFWWSSSMSTTITPQPHT